MTLRSALPCIAGALRRSLLAGPPMRPSRSVRKLPGPFPVVVAPVSTSHRVSLPTPDGYSSRSLPALRDVGGGWQAPARASSVRPIAGAQRQAGFEPLLRRRWLGSVDDPVPRFRERQVTEEPGRHRTVLEDRPGADEHQVPSHRAFVGRADIGAAWSKQSKDGGLSLKLDDPIMAK